MLVPSTKPLLNKVCSEIWVWWWYRYTFIYTTYVYKLYISTCMLLSTHIYSVLQYIIYMFCKFIYIYTCLLGFIDHNFSLNIWQNISTQVWKNPAQNTLWFFASQIWVRSEAEVAIIGSTIAWGSQRISLAGFAIGSCMLGGCRVSKTPNQTRMRITPKSFPC